MFSGLRSLVEDLAQPQPRPAGPLRSQSQDHSSPERSGLHGSRGSFDLSTAGRNVAQSTGLLAESALSNLRKSLAAQRPFTVSPPDGRTTSPQPDREMKPFSKLTLEDRLKASFAIGEASTATTPDAVSHAPSPKPIPNSSTVLSPKSTPLPESPLLSPALALDSRTMTPLDLSDSAPSSSQTNGDREHPLAVDPAPPAQSEKAEEVLTETRLDPEEVTDVPESTRHPEADVPLPPFFPEPTNLAASPSYQSSHSQEGIDDEDKNRDISEVRLQELEQKLSDVSMAMEQMKNTQDALNTVLAEFTPVSNMSDIKGLREYLESSNAKQNLLQEEIKRLQARLRTYDERIEELRDTHRLESRSQTDLVDSLRKQLDESEALLKAAQSSSAQASEETQKRQTELDQLRTEAQKYKDTAKEEEEKRTKAISLLKTVRQKLVKAEKDRDEAVRESAALKETDKAEKEKAKAEKDKLAKEIEAVRAEKAKDIAGLKAHFDNELATMKDRLEKEYMARKGQLELEAVTTKASFQKEITAKNSKIQSLEASVRSLNSERDSLFDQIQMRQAELESSQSHLESLQSSSAELQFQLREAMERSALVIEELADARRELEYRELRPSISAEDATRVRSALTAKYESKVNELSARLAAAEKDRNETEAVLSRSLQQKAQEIESLRTLIDSSSRSKGVSEEEMANLKHEIEQLQQQVASYKEQLSELDRQREHVQEVEDLLRKQSDEFSAQSQEYERVVAEAKEREMQFRNANKSLREELRKVQSSAALLERQRNPGVGYWSTVTRHESSSEARLSSPSPSSSDLASLSRTASPSLANAKNDEEVNLEYLRNVILQFLEHKEMRPHLVRVLSIILHFTPQETRRLVAKVS